MQAHEGARNYILTATRVDKKVKPCLPSSQSICNILYNDNSRLHNYNLLGKHEWNHVSDMHALGGRPSTCVQVELFAIFMQIEDIVDVSVREEYASS